MMIQDCHTYAKLPASDMVRARRFSVETLGLKPVADGPESLRFRNTDGSSFVVFLSSGRASGDHDQCGWVVDDIEAECAGLRRRGVVFEEFPGYEFEDGIAIAPRGRTAWFRDSEGDLLNLRSFDSPTGAPDRS
jgi:catechol 2,3-dioxygenase-like lactoylglutathione lyase family enzyme